MKYFIVGTAGHVDHGKSTLIRALTGIETDRLPEEQARGLSIDLGFAHLELPGEVVAGIVDVPGHERFLKNMLAGVGGYDLGMLVVDAQEGVMPQTREHLEILELLKTRAGLVVLSKVDAVEADFLDLVEEDLRDYLSRTFLGRAPLVRVSARTGHGLEALKKTLAELLRELPARNRRSPFRLPIDRVFVKSGFGTVVTGSLWSGTLRKGDSVAVLPGDAQTKVRGLQVHGASVEEAWAGQRVAVNLTGMEAASLGRGMWLAPPSLLTPTELLDARLDLLARLPRPLKQRSRVRFYAGTAEHLGRTILLEGETMAPGQTGLVQLVLDEPAVLQVGDRFVLRDFTARLTLGGGEVLDTAPTRHRKGDTGAVESLRRREKGGPEEALLEVLRRASGGVRAPSALAQELQVPLADVEAMVEKLVRSGEATVLGKHVAEATSAAAAEEQILAVLSRLESGAPWKPGWRKEEVLKLVASPTPKLAEEVLAELARSGQIKDLGGLYCTRSHEPQLTPSQQKCLERVEQVLRQGGFAPPDWEEVVAAVGMDARQKAILESYLLDTGRAVKIAPTLLFLEETLERARQVLAEAIRSQGPQTAAQCRDLLGTTRKYIIPLMEHFDRTHFTQRDGDVRILFGQRVPMKQ
ncbi:MAG: selenocysteine-specific translation elongation factor [Candidatus Eremiobacterota bacterium]